MYDFIRILVSSDINDLLSLLVVVVPIIILSIFALRNPELYRETQQKPDVHHRADGQSLKPAQTKILKRELPVYTKTTAAILFIDLRNFHHVSQGKTAEEIASVLNDFFECVDAAVANQGGWIDNFMGDSILVVFGKSYDAKKACQKALRSIVHIRHSVKKLNRKLSKKTGDTMQIGIGLHVGPVLIGKFGKKNNLQERVVGPAINIATRLEELAKQNNSQIIMTVNVAKEAGLDEEKLDSEYVVLRDNNIPVEVLSYTASQALPKV